MAELSWVGVSLLTGEILADLPGVELTQPMSVTIGQVESAQVTLHLSADTNPDWLIATQHGATAMVAYVGDPAYPTVVYGGIVTQRIRDTSASVQLSLSTAESYLAGCYVGDYTGTSENQDSIVADLMGFATGTNQIPFTLLHLPNASTFLQTVAIASTDQITVLSALQSLSAISGGPEWTIFWDWNLAAGTITPTFAYGARIGSAATPGSAPNITIELPDLLPGSSITEDYSEGYGANSITAVGVLSPNSTSTTDTLPTATATSANLNGRPLWAYSYQPDATVSDPAILADYAEQANSEMTDGAQPLALTIANDLPGKTFGVDWFLGDDIGWSFADTLAFPLPVSGTARCIGYQVDYTTITPVLKGAAVS